MSVATGHDRDQWVREAFDATLRDRMRSLATPELIAEHAASPAAPSDALARLLELFRRAPLAGKYIVVAMGQFSDYRVGMLAGGPGTPIEIGETPHATADAAYHAIFLRRLRDIGVELP